jgi:2-methylcitrate dehydratase PrpD
MTASRVEIRLKNGRTLVKQVDIPKGDPRDPMTAEDLADKVRRFASQKNERTLDQVISLSLKLEKVGDIRQLTSII